jgi:hypothetical protein
MIVQQVLHRAARGKANELTVESFAERNLTMPTERVPTWRHQDQANLREGKTFQLSAWINGLSDNADIAAARGD